MRGLLVLDKPPGISSFAALKLVRNAAGRRIRIGHAGTLDPFATGVLLALLGDATRLAELAVALPKRYEATVRFGIATDTLDPDGTVTDRADPGSAAPAALPAVLGDMTGEIEQVPPAFSAVKVDGKRAYRLARDGQSVEVSPRTVRIDAIDLLEENWPEARIAVRCGSGTYIRSLARDVGAALGLPAYLIALRRTAVGPFVAEGALVPGGDTSREDVRARLLRPVVVARAAGLPLVRLPREHALAFAAGGAVPADAPEEPFAVTAGETDLLLGLGWRSAPGRIRPRKVFSGARNELRG